MSVKILIVKSSALGDIVHVFPVIEYLKNKFPEAQIDWVVEKAFEGLPKAHPYISNVITVDTRSWRKGRNLSDIFAFKKSLQSANYDVIFDLQGNCKSAVITWLANSVKKIGFGKATVSETPNLWVTTQQFDPPTGQNIRDDYLYIVKSYFADTTPLIDKGITLHIDEVQRRKIEDILCSPKLKDKKRFIICPGAAWPNKRVAESALVEFLELLAHNESVAFLFAWGSPEEKEQALKLHAHFYHRSIMVDRLPLATLQNLMSRVDQVIAMDSLPLHLAGTTAVSTFSLFGPSNSSKYRPQGAQHRSFQGSCPYGQQFTKRCPRLRTCSTGACIRALTGAEIYQAYGSK